MAYQLYIEQSDVSTKAQRGGARFKMRKPGGGAAYPINDCSDVRDAWSLRSRSSLDRASVESHIRRAASALGCKGPWNASASQEDDCMNDQVLTTFLTLERDGVPGVTIVQEPSSDSGNRMRMRVPFYVGDSVARASGFPLPILWQSSILPETVRQMKALISEGRQPLTVYPRHAHAFDSSHLPVGSIVDVEQQGRVGYAVLEIEPTEGDSGGKNVQILARGRKINAVSLRAAPGNYRLEQHKVNGQEMLVAQELLPNGIDFAPDGPAQPTYGLELLNEAAVITPLDPSPTTEDDDVTQENLTLEKLRGEHATLVQAIEAPLRQELDELKGKHEKAKERIKSLEQEAATADKAAYVERVCTKLSQEQAEALRAYAATVESKAELAEKVSELLLSAPAQTPPPDAFATLRAKLFPGSGAGRPQVIDGGQQLSQEDLGVEANLPN